MEHQQFHIRKAEEKDLSVLLGFEQEIVKTERPFDPTIKDGNPNYYDLLQLIRSPEAEVLVAEANDEIIASGYGMIKKAQDYLKHQYFLYLGFMYVKPNFRGKGVNQAIVEQLGLWARAKNITELRLDVYDQNISAIKAYEKTGFKPHMLEMRRDITAG